MNAYDLTDPDAPIGKAGPPQAGPFERQWTITRHSDVSAVLRSPDFQVLDVAGRVERIGNRAGQDYGNLLAVLRATMVFQNGEMHSRSRKSAGRLLGEGQVVWTPKILLDHARAIVMDSSFDGEVDVVAALAYPLPCLVLSGLLALDFGRCKQLCDMAVSTTDAWLPSATLQTFGAGEATSTALHAALSRYSGEATPICALSSGDPADSAADLAIFLLVAGAESTAGTISAALDILSRNTNLQERLRNDAKLIPGFIRETLRLAGPLRQLNRRIATSDVSIGGADIKKGDVVVLRTDSAHRDPAAYSDPDKVQVDRKEAGLLAFGGGSHICQGATIGMAEAGTMVRAVLERYRLQPGSRRGRLLAHQDWRVFQTLPLQLSPVQASSPQRVSAGLTRGQR